MENGGGGPAGGGAAYRTWALAAGDRSGNVSPSAPVRDVRARSHAGPHARALAPRVVALRAAPVPLPPGLSGEGQGSPRPRRAGFLLPSCPPPAIPRVHAGRWVSPLAAARFLLGGTSTHVRTPYCVYASQHRRAAAKKEDAEARTMISARPWASEIRDQSSASYVVCGGAQWRSHSCST
jgi:hypothetical protein